MCNNGARDVFVGGCETRRNDKRVMVWQHDKVNFETVLNFPLNIIPHPSLFIRKKLFTEVGGMNENITYGPDLDLIFRLSQKTDFDTSRIILVTNTFNSFPDKFSLIKRWGYD